MCTDHSTCTWPEARARAADARPLPLRHVAVEAAVGLVLARDVHARCALPPCDTSAMDGYAVCGPAPWQLVGSLRAEQVRRRPLRPGEAIEIATGAAVPAGATAVLRYEDAGGCDGRITGDVRPGRDIRPRGGDLRAGELLVAAGTRLSPLAAGLAASSGRDEVAVRPRPRVAVTLTGEEIVRQGPPGAGIVRDALGPALPGLLAGAGADVVHVARLGDDTQQLRDELAGTDCDVHVVTGGSSAGPADTVHKALADLGAQLRVDGVRCRPGGPQLLAVLPGGRRVVGLPGNPLAAVAGLATLVVPLLAALDARASVRHTCALPPGVTPRADATTLRPVRLGASGDGTPEVLPVTSSASLRSAARATHLLAVDPDGGCELLPLPGALP